MCDCSKYISTGEDSSAGGGGVIKKYSKPSTLLMLCALHEYINVLLMLVKRIRDLAAIGVVIARSRVRSG